METSPSPVESSPSAVTSTLGERLLRQTTERNHRNGDKNYSK